VTKAQLRLILDVLADYIDEIAECNDDYPHTLEEAEATFEAVKKQWELA
jgi:hypothetical protein